MGFRIHPTAEVSYKARTGECFQHAGDVFECIRGCDAVIIMVAHNQYRELALRKTKLILRNPMLIDGQHIVYT